MKSWLAPTSRVPRSPSFAPTKAAAITGEHQPELSEESSSARHVGLLSCQKWVTNRPPDRAHTGQLSRRQAISQKRYS